MSPAYIQYVLDAHDCIVSVNAEWTKLASDNGSPTLQSANIIGKPFNSFVSDPSMKELFRLILVRARKGIPLTLRYRCDTATHRRTFAMNVTLLPDNQVEFASLLIRETVRVSVELLEPSRPRDSRLMRICSWCQMVQMPDQSWDRIETALPHYGYLEAETLPTITHGMCEKCRQETFDAVI